MTKTGWSQTKIHKLESGRATQVLVDDVFELAVALDVSPLYLLTPVEPFDGDAKAFKVCFGQRLSFWPRDVRAWIRGVRPLLHLRNYRTNDDAEAGRRHYLLDSQPQSEWLRIIEAGDYGRRAIAALAALMPPDDQK